ncbi:MAG: ABC transporter ATP-binding protein [Oscillospiraceae bacterium]|nr:ABC transporter ATP-binding protein [Oscillospiraceae bacterium]
MDLQIRDLSHRFGEKIIFSHFDLTLEKGGLYGLTAPSGRGKTTLLRILMGLQIPDSGSVPKGIRYSAVFQTDRLLPGRSPAEQLLLVRGKKSDRGEAERFLSGLLPRESLKQPVEELSGGMQRRVAIARALWAESDCVLMDEPFTGLDEETLRNTVDFILANRKGRTLLLSTHQRELLEPWPFRWLSLPSE